MYPKARQDKTVVTFTAIGLTIILLGFVVFFFFASKTTAVLALLALVLGTATSITGAVIKVRRYWNDPEARAFLAEKRNRRR